MRQPAIMPPESSRAGKNIKKLLMKFMALILMPHKGLFQILLTEHLEM